MIHSRNVYPPLYIHSSKQISTKGTKDTHQLSSRRKRTPQSATAEYPKDSASSDKRVVIILAASPLLGVHGLGDAVLALIEVCGSASGGADTGKVGRWVGTSLNDCGTARCASADQVEGALCWVCQSVPLAKVCLRKCSYWQGPPWCSLVEG